MDVFRSRLGLGVAVIPAMLFVSALLAGTVTQAADRSSVRFTSVEMREASPPVPPSDHYRNPILPGFSPDPSIVRVGEDFYLTTSTFAWFPGLPVYHSRDLVHWRHVGDALDRSSQIKLSVATSKGIYAPDISYHNGTFYIAGTCVDCGGNFIITAADPAGPWSEPRWLRDVEGFDPSLFFDDDGSVWLINHATPSGGARYRGHGAIWLRRINLKTFAVGLPIQIVDGGLEPAKNPVWIEGPHVFRREGRLYLILAEGGTGLNHSQVVFSAERMEGPWRPAPMQYQPILTQRDLPADRRDPVIAAGHADLVDTGTNGWWAVFLAMRPAADGSIGMGRETFLMPVDWRNGWPLITKPGQSIPLVAPSPMIKTSAKVSRSSRSEGWLALRGPTNAWSRMSGSVIEMTPSIVPLGDPERQPTFLAKRQRSSVVEASAKVSLRGRSSQAAGLAAYLDERGFVTAAVVSQAGKRFIEVRRRGSATEPVEGVRLAASAIQGEASAELRLALNGSRATISYRTSKAEWIVLARDVETRMLSPGPGVFVGTMIGPFAQSLGD